MQPAKRSKSSVHRLKRSDSGKRDSQSLVLLCGVVGLVTFIVFYPTLLNDFVNWDDIVYVMNNNMIKNLSFSNFRAIFSTFYMGNYHPLPLLSFAADFHIAGLSPYIYHLHNLLLHIANSLLVFWFVYKLFPVMNLAFLVALLFGVHPMHVESIAWISERKDLLYTFYFFAAGIGYLYYLGKKQIRYYFAALLLFVLSLLSKAQAVTFPLVLVITDLLHERKADKQMIIEKIPFFVLSVVFGVIAIYAQEHDKSISSVDLTGMDSFFYGSYGLVLYLFKFFIPAQLCCLYEYPFTQIGFTPWYVYVSPLALVLLLYAVFVYRRKYAYVSYGLLFFFFTIFPVLQYLPVGQAFMAERYSYIPFVGLFIILSRLYLDHKRRPGIYGMLTPALYCWIIVLCLVSFNRTKVWKNSITLWSDVIKKYPRSVTAYVNRGFIYNNDTREYLKAMDDCNIGLAIDSTEGKLYYNRAISNKYLSRFDHAVADFERALRYSKGGYDLFMDRGIMYTEFMQQYDSGIADFRRVLAIDPEHKDAAYNIAVSYYKKANYDSALIYCEKSTRLDPQFGKAHLLLSLLYTGMKDYRLGLTHALEAQKQGETIDRKLMLFLQDKAANP